MEQEDSRGYGIEDADPEAAQQPRECEREHEDEEMTGGALGTFKKVLTVELVRAPCRISTVKDLLRAFGGPDEFARHFGYKPSTVKNWSAWNRIPAKEYTLIFSECWVLGIPVDPKMLGLEKVFA